jgi:hypothetical protein
MKLYLVHTLVYGMYQGRNMTNAQYLEKFQIRVSVIKQYGGGIGSDKGSVKEDLVIEGITSPEETDNSSARAKDKYLVLTFLSCADELSHGNSLKTRRITLPRWSTTAQKTLPWLITLLPTTIISRSPRGIYITTPRKYFS